jgi:predicted outer membrane repeat protein
VAPANSGKSVEIIRTEERSRQVIHTEKEEKMKKMIIVIAAVFLITIVGFGQQQQQMPTGRQADPETPQLERFPILVPGDYPTSQAAIDAAVDGDTIIVSPGTYYENIDFQGKAITIKSKHGPDVTVLDGGGAGSVVTFQGGEGPDSVLEGFTITNGGGTYSNGPGGGIFVSNAGPSLKGNRITGCTSLTMGGAVHVENDSSPILVDNVIENNTALDKGAALSVIDSFVEMINNQISGNEAAYGGAFFIEGISTKRLPQKFTGNMVTGNRATQIGGAVYCSNASPEFEQNTFSGNTAGDGGGAFYADNDSAAVLFQNIFDANIAENADSKGGAVYGIDTLIELLENEFSNNEADYGAAVYLDNTSSASRAPIKFTGNLVTLNTATFIGGAVYSTSASPEIELNTFSDNSAGDLGGAVYLENNPFAWIIENVFANNTADNTDSMGGALFSIDTIVEMLNNDLSGNRADYGAAMYLDNSSIASRAPLKFTGNLISSNKAKKMGGATFTKAVATDFEDNTFSSNSAGEKGGAFYAENNSSLNLFQNLFEDNTADDPGSAGGAVFTIEAIVEILQNTFTGNVADTGGAVQMVNSTASSIIANALAGNKANVEGAAVVVENSSPEITENVLVGNEADTGGAMILKAASAPPVNKNVFAGNKVVAGGGMHIDNSSPVLTNNIICGNEASGEGGGIYTDSTTFRAGNAIYTNNTIVMNKATVGGGIHCGSTSPEVTNTVLWYNEPDQVHAGTGSPTVTYCNVEGGWPDPTNIALEPMFKVVEIGNWTMAGSYNPNTSLVALRDTSASWSTDEHKGKLVNPDVNQDLMLYIVTNNSTTLMAWADWQTISSGASWVGYNAAYEIYDFHLNFGSPCIDTGDNNAPSIPAKDFEGDDRILDGNLDSVAVVDMGVDEFILSLIYVPDDYSTIQAAINAATDGDTIIVRPGTYMENIDYLGKEITVRSEQGPLVTIIDGNQAGHVVLIESVPGIPVIEGFTLRNGYLADSNGAGIRCFNASALIKNNIITQNAAYGTYNGRAGGVDCGGNGYTPQLIGNLFIDNYSQIRGGGINVTHDVVATMENCVFWNNTAGHGGGALSLRVDATLNVNNCTVYDNTANYGGAVLIDWDSVLNAKDTIFWGNNATYGKEMFIDSNSFGSATVSLEYSDVQGGTGSIWVVSGATLNWGAGMINANPLFLSAGTGDFRLQQDPCQPGVTNPCVDTGNPGSTMITGTTRSDGVQDAGVIDMGYHYEVTLPVPLLYVPDDCPTIQEAIDAVDPGGTVIVKPGTYNESIDYHGKAVTVQSEAGRGVTVIDGYMTSAPVVSFESGEGPDSVLEGFTIINGNTILGGGGINCVNKSSPTIRNNTIANNNSHHIHGGGIHCSDESSPTIENNLIYGNETLGCGGGICCFLTCSPVITNCTITGNSASEGGGICCFNSTHLVVENTILWSNTATTNGKEIFIGWLSASITIDYSDVDGGLASVFVDAGSTLNWGSNMIDADPLFVTGSAGDFYLSQIAAGQGSDSPCVDTGDPVSAMITGTTRTDEVQDSGVVDMGFHYPLP